MSVIDEPIFINGSHGEGGGALFRTALAMSALTRRPLAIHSIRGATRKPGLNPEDAAILAALTIACSAETEAEIDSERLEFAPKHIPKAINFNYDIAKSGSGRSPGNTLIVAQTLAPLLARTGAYSTLELFGETHNNNTLTFDAFELSTCPAHHKQGLGIYPHISTAGFGYAGRGHTVIEIEPSASNPIIWRERGDLVAAGARITTVDAHSQLIADAHSRALQLLTEGKLGDTIQHIELRGPEPGLCLTFWAQFQNGAGSTGFCLNRGSKVADGIANAWTQFQQFLQSNATTDPYLSDQLLLNACLTEGTTTLTTPLITRRLKTVAWVIKQFLPIAITIKGVEGSPGTITISR